jgi:hypothetical protein
MASQLELISVEEEFKKCPRLEEEARGEVSYYVLEPPPKYLELIREIQSLVYPALWEYVREREFKELLAMFYSLFRRRIKKKEKTRVVLKRIERKVMNGTILSFRDIKAILRLIGNPKYWDHIFKILNMDIELRDRNYKIFGEGCIEHLHRLESALSNHLHNSHSKGNSNKLELIKERLRAVILHEHARLLRESGLKFINGEISYDEYLKRMREYSIDASKLWPK